MERLSLKLIKSIYYHYLPKRLVAETAQIIQIIVIKSRRFADRSILHMIFTNFKKKGEKDRAFTNIFRSFVKKLEKGKGYIPVEKSEKVKNPNQIFKVFKERVFNEKVHILTDTSNILESLSKRESLELE